MTRRQLYLIVIFTLINLCAKAQPLATYHIQGLNDGYYQVSLIPHTTWTGTNAITATGQVTLKVGTSTSINDYFTISDLTMLIPGLNWSQNSRYNAPAEDALHDYISFGLDSKGTQDIPYMQGDTVPLFKFKNLGICSEDSIFLMAIDGDPFQWPNAQNANVGQQLSVSGYNSPDVPLAVSGIVPCMAEVLFCFNAKLQGPFDGKQLMKDSLRVKNYIPKKEPYKNYFPLYNFNLTGSGVSSFQHVDDGGNEYINDTTILFVQGEDAIVDWVFVELRSQHDSSIVLSTRSALIQRDGDIVETDGVSKLKFRKLKSDNYFFSVRHRNHLGLMSESKLPIYSFEQLILDTNQYANRAQNGCTNFYDFSNVANNMHGVNAGYINVDTFGNLNRLMWAGNSNADQYIMFQGGGLGLGLDIDYVYFNIITDWAHNTNSSYNHVSRGYYSGDNNLDGFVKYQGPANDVDPFIFFNIMKRHPANINKYVNFYITEQLPE